MIDIDQIIARETADLVLDCKPGCDHCCQQLIVITCIDDARNILRAAKAQMTAKAFKQFKREVRQQAKAIEALSHEEAETRRWPCPLLKDHRCSVYEVRPVACRSVVSEDASCCQAMLAADDFEQLSDEHQSLATTISERAMSLQFTINDQRPIDGAFELLTVLAKLIDKQPIS